ncbi:unnamed protein product, partial [Arctogadus glacialis]
SVPGPGQYHIRGQFDKPVDGNDNPSISCPPFLSETKRFKSAKEEGPPVGTYTDPRCALELLKRPLGSKRGPFGGTAVRFTRQSLKHSTPGPGSYNMFDCGLAQESVKRATLESTRKGGFGCHAQRNSVFHNVQTLDAPGPGQYVVTKPSEELYKRQPMAVFRSATQRMAASLLAKDTPPPNSYDIVAFDKSFGHASLAEPRTKGAKRFQGGFLSSEPRVSSFLQSDPNLPGPGQYSPVTKTSPQQTLFVCREDRFKVQRNSNPGPGTYQECATGNETETFCRSAPILHGPHRERQALLNQTPKRGASDPSPRLRFCRVDEAAAGETDEKNWVDPKEMKIALNAESREETVNAQRLKWDDVPFWGRVLAVPLSEPEMLASAASAGSRYQPHSEEEWMREPLTCDEPGSSTSRSCALIAPNPPRLRLSHSSSPRVPIPPRGVCVRCPAGEPRALSSRPDRYGDVEGGGCVAKSSRRVARILMDRGMKRGGTHLSPGVMDTVLKGTFNVTLHNPLVPRWLTADSAGPVPGPRTDLRDLRPHADVSI